LAGSLSQYLPEHLVPRLNTLFARLLMAQIGLALALGLVFGALFYVERNVTIAVLYAERWAPQLASAAGLVAGPGAPAPEVMRRSAPPERARRPWAHTPRFAALRDALATRGVPVDDVVLGLSGPEPTVWLHVVSPGQAPVWLGVAGQLVETEWSRRALLALVLVSGLLVGVSWVFTRRITRPLERLRERMRGSTAAPDDALPAAPGPSVSTEIVAIDAAYSELLARLQRHERERAVLLAGVSHDLRSPLGRIRMAAELLPDAAELAPRKASIVRNVAQADRLIESFLDFVRSGELAFDETVDLAAAARSVVAGFERPASELAVSAPAALPWPRANRLLVERLLANLIDNALKHGRPPVRLVLGADTTQAWMAVEDAGDGIVPEQVSALQEAFTRGDASRADTGSGLGLAIVRQVVLRLGGELSFERGEGFQRVRVSLRWSGG
jgi:two-component system, OmpR family, osmolarity sensor histidine kinase EnvZ